MGFRKGGEALLRGISLNPCFHELVYSPAYLPLIHYVSIVYPPNILCHQDQGKVGSPLGYLVAAIGGNVGGTVAGLVGPRRGDVWRGPCSLCSASNFLCYGGVCGRFLTTARHLRAG